MYRRTYVSTTVLTHVRSYTYTCIRTSIISPYRRVPYVLYLKRSLDPVSDTFDPVF